MTRGDWSGLEGIVTNDTRRVQGEDVRTTNFRAGQALSETIKTTLGPKGLDKMLVSSDGEITVTNDGASILDRMDIVHPAATVIVEIARQQDSRSSDGTTTAVLLAGELLSRAERLVEEGVHPTTIERGYRLATDHATDVLEAQTVAIDPRDDDALRNVARTVITGKWDDESSEFLAETAVEAARAIESDREIDFEKITRKAYPGSSYFDSEVVDGLVIDLEESSTSVVSLEPTFPRTFEDAAIALVDGQLTIDTPTGQGPVRIESPEQLESFKERDRATYRGYADAIAGAGADLVFCQKSIDDPARYYLVKNGVFPVERTRRDELHKLERATGARAVHDVSELSPADVGNADRIDRRTIGETEVVIVSADDHSDHVSMILRGGTRHVSDETKRVVGDCLSVLRLAIENEALVPGGGAPEVHVAQRLREFATDVRGREQLAVGAFADALEVVPRTLAECAGMDPIDSVVELRTRHSDGDHHAGLALDDRTVADMYRDGVLEPVRIKRQAITGATEAVSAIIRVDDVVATASDDHGHDHDHDHDHGPGGMVESTDGLPWAVGHSMNH